MEIGAAAHKNQNQVEFGVYCLRTASSHSVHVNEPYADASDTKMIAAPTYTAVGSILLWL